MTNCINWPCQFILVIKNRFITAQTFTRNDVLLLTSGKPFFSRLEQLIAEAKYVLHLQFYIFDHDQTGRRIFELLVEAAQRGVKVFVVVDAYASEQLNNKVLAPYREAGIIIRRFSQINSQRGFRIGRRLHHKIVWVDGHTALIGGINIADKYSGYHGQEPWLDFAVEVKGGICDPIRKVCNEILPNRLLKNVYNSMPPVSHAAEQSFYSRIVKNDWLRRKIEISYSYRQAIRRSKTSLVIVASYFLPGTKMRSLIKKASARGVKITVILVGASDVPVVKPAMTWLYDFLLRNKVTIYEWKKSVLHGKIAVADHKWTTVGSYNLNALSDYGSLELNVEVLDEQFAAETEQLLNRLIADGCEPILETPFKNRKNWLIQFGRWCSYQAVRLSLRVLFFFMKKNEHKKNARF